MKILLTNDDGVDAPGLAALAHAVSAALGDAAEIIVVAPDRGRSECGHSVTTSRPLKLAHVREDWVAIDGTPVDCVRAALGSIVADADMVISGINAGANLGVDLLVSGTFAAAREAAIAGIAAMAVSHYRRPDVPATWDHVPQWLESTIAEFAEARCKIADSGRAPLWNVNLPAIDPDSPPPPRVRCPIDPSPIARVVRSAGESLHFESDFHSRPRKVGFDVEHCFSGRMTISEVSPHPP